MTFLVTVFSLSRLCFAPVSGLLAQRLGERRIYIGGLLIVAVSTAACAFSQTYWQLLLFRVLSGIGSTMFYVSALGLMIHISPADARGRIAGLFTTSFMVGAVGGPAVGGLAAGWGLTAPFVVYGVALLGVAVVLFYSLRNSALAAPPPPTRSMVTMREALRGRAYRSALLSNFATGWSAFGLRIALVPLFISDVMGGSVGVIGWVLAAFAGGNALAVVPSGYLSDRMGRRTLLIIGLAASGVATVWLGLVSSLPAFTVAAFVSRCDDRHLYVTAAGRGRRHPGQRGPRGPSGGGGADGDGSGRDRRVHVGRLGRRATELRLGLFHQRSRAADRRGRLGGGAGNAAGAGSLAV